MKIYDNETISKKIKQRDKITKIIMRIVNPILIILFIICVTLFIKKILFNEKNPSFLGFKTFIIASGSMEPKLNVGDMVIIKETKQEKIKKDDIITFKEEDKETTVTHRIIEVIEKDGMVKYRTKGDNNNTADSYLVSYDNIEGVYQFKIGKIGAAILKSQNIIAIIGIITFFYILFVIGEKKEDKNIIRHKKRKEYEEKNLK